MRQQWRGPRGVVCDNYVPDSSECAFLTQGQKNHCESDEISWPESGSEINTRHFLSNKIRGSFYGSEKKNIITKIFLTTLNTLHCLSKFLQNYPLTLKIDTTEQGRLKKERRLTAQECPVLKNVLFFRELKLKPQHPQWAAHNVCNSSSRDPMPSSGLHWNHVHITQSHI